jgi:hypothetical protein
MRTLALALTALAALAAPGWSEQAVDRLRAAKTLFFDREYAEAREAWRAVRASGGRAEAEAALYWIARCSEALGERERALTEYGEYLALRPADRTLAEEAKTSRIGLAVKLHRSGATRHLPIAREALSDTSRSVRYFAALQIASLGPEIGREAVPVLKEILAREKDDDLVERAKLALLRVDRSALAEAVQPAVAPARTSGWVRVRIYEKGQRRPQVSINLPVALAELVFKSLPEEARTELRKQGYDGDRFFEQLRKTGPTDILTIEGDDGERIQVWIE